MSGHNRVLTRSNTARICVRASCLAVAGASIAAGSALAAGNGLPRTYDVSRLDSPVPSLAGQYPLAMVNAGDLNGDGKEDFITSQLANTRNDAGVISANGNGAIYIVSGATGERIKTIEAPDKGDSGNAANFAFPGFNKIGANRRAPARFTDIGSCTNSPPNAGELCRSATVGPPDGIPDIVVGARGVDARGLKDAGRVYLYDGATFALLKRIDQPASDTTPVALSRSGGSWFGRRMLNLASSPPCEGNAGIGPCETQSPGNDLGDTDGGGLPDLVVSASATSEDQASAYPTSHCARTPQARCQGAGRVYVFRGENIVGSSPSEILDGTVPSGGTAENVTTIRNIHAQADDLQDPAGGDSEIFGNSLTAVGDVGACRATVATAATPSVPPPPAGDTCPRANATTTPDGKPDFMISGNRTDLPVDNPDRNFIDAGTSYLVDGATNTILAIYTNPEPQRNAVFGQVDAGYPAGDLGDTGLPDAFIPAVGKNVPGFTGAGRGYVLNGNFTNGTLFRRLDDPTPGLTAGFGAGYTGVGDLVPGAETPANELLIGGAGSRTLAPGDVHFFNPATEKALQSIPDPDAQASSQFGANPTPLGDLNGDGFLDFSVAAPLYDSATSTDEGRVYVFRSNNSPLAPVAAPAARPAAGQAAATPPSAGDAAPATAPSAAPSPATAKAALLSGRCANALRGTDKRDNLVGTSAGDTVFGRGGDDVIKGLGGRDCIDAGRDDDTVSAGAGNDSMLGGAGKDQLDGDSGADRLFGQSGNDVLAGGSGRDMLAAGDGNDRLIGGTSVDRLFGERGNDTLRAGTSAGGLLDGGSGNDTIYAANGVRDTVKCGTGSDRAVVDRVDKVASCERVTRKRA